MNTNANLDVTVQLLSFYYYAIKRRLVVTTLFVFGTTLHLLPWIFTFLPLAACQDNDWCQTNPCYNGGTCRRHSIPDLSNCDCSSDFEGRRCEYFRGGVDCSPRALEYGGCLEPTRPPSPELTEAPGPPSADLTVSTYLPFPDSTSSLWTVEKGIIVFLVILGVTLAVFVAGLGMWLCKEYTCKRGTYTLPHPNTYNECAQLKLSETMIIQQESIMEVQSRYA